MSTLKNRFDNNTYFNFLNRILTDCRETKSYYSRPWEIADIQPFVMDKFQFEFFMLKIEVAKGKPFYNMAPEKYDIYSMTEGPMHMVNILLGLLRDMIESEIEIDHFKYYMKILKYYVNIHKFVLLKAIDYKFNNPDGEYVSNNFLFTDFEYDDYFIKPLQSLPDFFLKYENTEENRIIVEKFIDENIRFFTEYVFINRKKEELNRVYLISTWQNLFPFSEEFLRKNKDYFLVPQVVKNPKLVNSKEKLNFIFKDILEDNLNFIIKFNSLGRCEKKVNITPEKLEEYVLLYFVNS